MLNDCNCDVTSMMMHDADRTYEEFCMLQLCEQTRKEIAQRVEPSTKSEIAQRLAQKDTEAALISDAMLDEVMYMVQQGKVKPADKRTVPNLHEIDGKWVIKYKKTLDVKMV